MSVKRVLVIVMASALLLAVGIGPGVAGNVRALPGPGAGAAGTTIPYAGRLNDQAGQPVAEGAYDFTFALYAAETGGEPLWSEVQTGVPVARGEFRTTLGSVAPIPAAALSSRALWLAVSVRGPGEAGFTALAPRQRVSAAAPTAGAACPHDHFGESWSGGGLVGLYVDTPSGNLSGALYGRTGGIGSGVLGVGGGSMDMSIGVWGTSASPGGYGGKFENTGGGIALHAEGNGAGNQNTALWVKNTNPNHGMAATLHNNSDYATAHAENAGVGEVLVLVSHGGRFLRAVDQNWDPKFRMEANGEAYADGDWNDGGADFAEMLPAVAGLEPGDVLAIGPDGTLVRSTELYQTSVAGVYSTDPGFVAGVPIEGKIPGTIPLAMAGAVPVKVSAENGPIRPGDLLVTSGTPGHAMRAGPNPPQGTVIGKALEKWDTGTGVIKMLAVLQ